jgi:hypothetical protein
VPHLEVLKTKLLDRHYPESIVNMQIEKARKKDRKQMIYQGKKQKTKDRKVRLILKIMKPTPQSTNGNGKDRSF